MRAVTRASVPSGSTQDCSGTPVRVLGPSKGRLTSIHVRPSLLVSENTSEKCLPRTVLAVEDHHAVGQGVDGVL
jgi:hypothetical protein